MPGRLQNRVCSTLLLCEKYILKNNRGLVCFGYRCRLVRAHDRIECNIRVLISLPYSGIGLESSLLFAQEGANVLLVDVNLEAAEKTLKLVNERYPNVKASAVKADVSKEADVKAAVDKAVELFGRLDVMVGIFCSQY